VVSESQIALILQIGSIFESSDFPFLLDMLAASQEGGDSPKQTVSVKTISVIGASGVLQTEEDVDTYLAALRSALIQTLNDGKRISL
jgi:tagatose-1,6-bisphosphate aldolase